MVTYHFISCFNKNEKKVNKKTRKILFNLKIDINFQFAPGRIYQSMLLSKQQKVN